MAGGVFGIGGRGDRYGSFTKTDAYDESKYQYKGYAGGARDESANLDYRRTLAEGREAPTVARGDAMQMRQAQGDALGQIQASAYGGTDDQRLLANAAKGKAPSRAEILGQQQAERSLQNQVSAAGNVRGGPGATAAAYRSASQGAATQLASANQGIQAERAAELAQARGAYSGAMQGARRDYANTAQGVRGQDENAAQFGATNELNSRQVNDARAMGYEQMGQQINRDQLQAGVEQQRIAQQSQQGANTLNADANKQNAETDKGILGAAIGTIAGGLGSIFKSDPAAKEPIGGSLAELSLGGMSPGAPAGASESFAGKDGLLGGSVAGEYKAHSDFATRFGSNPGAQQMTSAMAGKTPFTLSSEDAKVPTELKAQIEKDTEGANPYERDAQFTRGVAGAPRGYAAEHHSEPEPDGAARWSEPGKFGLHRPGANDATKNYGLPPGSPEAAGQAPGADDWNRYGGVEEKGVTRKTKDGKEYVKHSDKPKAGEGEPDWDKGGATKNDAPEPGGWRGFLGGALGGLQASMLEQSKQSARDTTTSDPAAKAAARLEGFQDGAVYAKAGGPKPDYVKGARVMESFERTDPKNEAKKNQSNAAGDAALDDAKKLASSKVPGAALPAGIIGAGGAVNKAAGSLTDPSYKAPAKKAEQRSDLMRQTAATELASGMLMPGVALGTLASEAVLDPWGLHARRRETTTSDERAKKGFGNVSDADMADAMRSMEPSPYRYKPEHRPPEQAPGEVNVGPMADEMARDKVARTAIVRDDDSDLLAIDKDKGLKLVMGSLASLQHQVDSMKGDAPRGNAKKARYRGFSAQS